MNKTYCFFSARYLPHLGGVERYTYNMAKKLITMGNRVIIVTSLIGNDPLYEENRGLIIFRLPSAKLLDGRFPILKYNKITKKILKEIKKIHVDYIIINTRFYLLSFIGALFAKHYNISSIVIEHGTGHFTVNNKIFDFLGHVYEHFISVLVRRNVTDYYGVSLECNKWLEHFNICAKGVLYNAIDDVQILDLYKKENNKIKSRIQFNNDEIIISFTGRLIREKGILKLVAAFNEVRKCYPKVKLCIAGDGDLYDDILKYNYDGVYLLGRLPFDEIIGLLKLSTIFCFPSDYPEGLPTSVLEAIACKNYVIASMAGGIKEVITDNSLGIVIEENTIKNIKESIFYVLENYEVRKNTIEKAYNKVLNEFTWSVTTGRLIDVFENS